MSIKIVKNKENGKYKIVRPMKDDKKKSPSDMAVHALDKKMKDEKCDE